MAEDFYKPLNDSEVPDDRDPMDQLIAALINFGKEDPYKKRLHETNLDRKKRRDELDRQMASQIYLQGRAEDATTEQQRRQSLSAKELQALSEGGADRRQAEQIKANMNAEDYRAWMQNFLAEDAAARGAYYGEQGAESAADRALRTKRAETLQDREMNPEKQALLLKEIAAAGENLDTFGSRDPLDLTPGASRTTARGSWYNKPGSKTRTLTESFTPKGQVRTDVEATEGGGVQHLRNLSRELKQADGFANAASEVAGYDFSGAPKTGSSGYFTEGPGAARGGATPSPVVPPAASNKDLGLPDWLTPAIRSQIPAELSNAAPSDLSRLSAERQALIRKQIQALGLLLGADDSVQVPPQALRYGGSGGRPTGNPLNPSAAVAGDNLAGLAEREALLKRAAPFLQELNKYKSFSGQLPKF